MYIVDNEIDLSNFEVIRSIVYREGKRLVEKQILLDSNSNLESINIPDGYDISKIEKLNFGNKTICNILYVNTSDVVVNLYFNENTGKYYEEPYGKSFGNKVRRLK